MCSLDNSNEKLPQYITSLLNDEELPSSSFVLFKRSIENSGAFESNPLAAALLRGMGLTPFASSNSIGDKLHAFELGTSTNMMDNTGCRYTLTSEQWMALRSKAGVLQGRLQFAESKAQSMKNRTY